MYGWRGRIGFLIAGGDRVVEAEAPRLAPEGVECHFKRLRLLCKLYMIGVNDEWVHKKKNKKNEERKFLRKADRARILSLFTEQYIIH